MIRFGEGVCRNPDSALRGEWLETNGIGGFASGTINGCRQCAAHGARSRKPGPLAARQPAELRLLLL